VTIGHAHARSGRLGGGLSRAVFRIGSHGGRSGLPIVTARAPPFTLRAPPMHRFRSKTTIWSGREPVHNSNARRRAAGPPAAMTAVRFTRPRVT
jgi:hypothetical protein